MGLLESAILLLLVLGLGVMLLQRYRKVRRRRR